MKAAQTCSQPTGLGRKRSLNRHELWPFERLLSAKADVQIASRENHLPSGWYTLTTGRLAGAILSVWKWPISGVRSIARSGIVLVNETIQIQARSVGRVEVDPSSYLIIDGERVSNRSFNGVELEKFTAINSRFEKCTFVNAKIRNACWGGGRKRTDYVECRFDGAKFGSIAPGNARFVGCSFENVRISEFCAHDVELINCKFSGLLKKGFLNGRRDTSTLGLFGRRKNRIEGNDFSECELRDFSFRTGISLERDKLPSGPHYAFIDDLRSTLEQAKAHVADWDSAEDRRLGEAIIGSMEMDLRDGQRQQLYIVNDSGQFATVSRRLAKFFIAG